MRPINAWRTFKSPGPWLRVEVLNFESIFSDEFAPGFDVFARFELDLEQDATVGVHGGFP